MEHTQIQKMTTIQRLAMIRQMDAMLKRDPKNFELWCNIGVLYSAEERWPEAQAHFKKALSLKKNDPQILARLLEAYRGSLDYLNARKIARKLVEIAPRNPEFLFQYGQVLSEIGNTDRAIEMMEKADRLSGGNPKILNVMTETLRNAGRFEETETIYERMRAIDPLDPDALYRYCHSRKFNIRDAEAIEPDLVKSYERAVEDGDDVGESYAMYSAGKVFQDAEDYDKAFNYFIKANKARENDKAGAAFAEISNAREVFTREFLKERSDFGVDSNQPIFIFGMPRSGTTLVESLLGAHSQVTPGDEQAYMGGIAKNLGIQHQQLSVFKERLERMTPGVSREIANDYLSMTKGIAGNTPYFTDKMPHNFVRLGIIHLLFPKAKLIHCERHPLDNAVSLFTNSMRQFHMSYKSDLRRLGLYYLQYKQLMRHYKEVLPGKILTIQYEDLVENTEFVSRKMIEHIGLDWEDNVMKRETSQKSVKTLSAWQVRQPVYQSSAGRWRNYEKHLAELIDVLGEEAVDYEAKLAALTAENQT